MRKFDHHIGDYASATGHLTLVEDGVYHRLLRHYYMTEQALPGDHAEVSRLVRARTKAERGAVDRVLCEFFYFDDASGTYRQDRCEREIVLTRQRSEQAAEKVSNEVTRMERYRQDRKRLFAGLRVKGQVPRWDMPMSELRELAKLHGVSLVVADEAVQERSAETDLQRTCNALATANHQPTTNHQPPTTTNTQQPAVAETGPARVVVEAPATQPETVPPATAPETAVLTERTQPAPEPIQPTPAGRVCRALKLAGIADVNPGHPDLLALIAAGCTDEEFTGAAAAVRAKGKGFGYLLGMLTKQRTEAAQKLASMHKGEMPAAARPAAAPAASHVVSAEETQAYLREQEAHRASISADRRQALKGKLGELVAAVRVAA